MPNARNVSDSLYESIHDSSLTLSNLTQRGHQRPQSVQMWKPCVGQGGHFDSLVEDLSPHLLGMDLLPVPGQSPLLGPSGGRQEKSSTSSIPFPLNKSIPIKLVALYRSSTSETTSFFFSGTIALVEEELHQGPRREDKIIDQPPF